MHNLLSWCDLKRMSKTHQIRTHTAASITVNYMHACICFTNTDPFHNKALVDELLWSWVGDLHPSRCGRRWRNGLAATTRERNSRNVGSFHRLQGIGTRAYGGVAVREFGTVLVLVDSAVDDGGKTHVWYLCYLTRTEKASRLLPFSPVSRSL